MENKEKKENNESVKIPTAKEILELELTQGMIDLLIEQPHFEEFIIDAMVRYTEIHVELACSQLKSATLNPVNEEIERLKNQNQTLINSDIEQLDEINKLQQQVHNYQMDIEHYKNSDLQAKFDVLKVKSDKLYQCLDVIKKSCDTINDLKTFKTTLPEHIDGILISYNQSK